MSRRTTATLNWVQYSFRVARLRSSVAADDRHFGRHLKAVGAGLVAIFGPPGGRPPPAADAYLGSYTPPLRSSVALEDDRRHEIDIQVDLHDHVVILDGPGERPPPARGHAPRVVGVAVTIPRLSTSVTLNALPGEGIQDGDPRVLDPDPDPDVAGWQAWCEPRMGGGFLWAATFSASVPHDLVTAFVASLASPAPVLRHTLPQDSEDQLTLRPTV